MENTRINECCATTTNYNACTNNSLDAREEKQNEQYDTKINISEVYIMEQDCIICYNTINEWLNETDIEVARKMLYYNLKNQSCGCIYEIHFECLIYWLLHNPCCPMCRRSVDINNANSPIHIRKDQNRVNISIGGRFDGNLNGDAYSTNTDDIVVDLEHCSYFDYINNTDENANDTNDNEIVQNEPYGRRCTTIFYYALCHVISIFIIALVIYSFITIFA